MGAIAELALPQPIEPFFPPPLRERLVALRRALHANPELSFKEEETARRLTAALSDLSPAQLDRVAGTGVVARIRGREGGAPVVAVRGDIDALPIEEATGLPFASRNVGVMHACGHDVHAAWAVGAAHLLAREPAAGDVLIVLQPAEETGSGALAILESGALDGVAAIFGGHVDRRFAVGQVVAEAGPLAASADTFEIVLHGQGAHAARPHEAADPIVGAGALIVALQTVVARRLNPASAGVVTVGSIHAGTAPNVIPDRATLTGTVRAVDPAVRRLLHDEVRRISEGVAATHRLQALVSLDLGTPPLVNSAEAADWARRAVAAVLGEDALVPLGFLNLAGEDFAHYLERIPGCFLRVGAREPGGDVVPAHAPRFFAAEESLFVGAAVLAETARVASRALHFGA
ncbi:MAG: M20 family metallopeptidase [Gemmatimonadota bacterium]|nr:M20 family metallopeptidase [Gemmatimonadota bacterium]